MLTRHTKKYSKKYTKNYTKKYTKNYTKNKKLMVDKCSLKKSRLKALPLTYFKIIARIIMSTLEENAKDSEDSKEICISILQHFPFCIKDKKNSSIDNSNQKYYFTIIKNIFENNAFNKTEKKRRIISALINMAWQHITTGNADIGVLQELDTYCKIKTCRPIKEEYEYYKKVHYLNEDKYSYM
jgi:hypothetical protein